MGTSLSLLASSLLFSSLWSHGTLYSEVRKEEEGLGENIKTQILECSGQKEQHMQRP